MRFVIGLVMASMLCIQLHAHQDARPMPPVIDTAGNTVDIVALSDNTPVISIRFLGAMCAHCMQQLALFQEYTEQLRAAKAVVVAFSDNDVAKCREVTKQYGFAGDVFSLCSDSGNVCSKAFGTTIEERNGTVTELHGVRILVKRSVIFEHYSATPYTDVRHILAMISRTTR